MDSLWVVMVETERRGKRHETLVAVFPTRRHADCVVSELRAFKVTARAVPVGPCPGRRNLYRLLRRHPAPRRQSAIRNPKSAVRRAGP